MYISVRSYYGCSFVGNKSDNRYREIPTEVGEQFAQRHNMYYLETSALEADNVERLFIQIASELMEVRIESTSDVNSIRILLAFFRFAASTLQRIT